MANIWDDYMDQLYPILSDAQRIDFYCNLIQNSEFPFNHGAYDSPIGKEFAMAILANKLNWPLSKILRNLVQNAGVLELPAFEDKIALPVELNYFVLRAVAIQYLKNRLENHQTTLPEAPIGDIVME